MARGKQKELPGVERESIPEINAAGENYVRVRDERMALTEREVEAHEALLEAMRTHKVKVYKDTEADPPLIMTRTASPASEKVKVSVMAAESPAEETDGRAPKTRGRPKGSKNKPKELNQESDEEAAKALA